MKKMYSVYVLKSAKTNTRYIGMTGKGPAERLKDHNESKNISTAQGKPYKLLYYETGYCKSCAIRREKFLKSGVGRKLLDLLEN